MFRRFFAHAHPERLNVFYRDDNFGLEHRVCWCAEDQGSAWKEFLINMNIE